MKFYTVVFLLIFLFLFDSYAQINTGYLGDPVFRVNFGRGTNKVGPALPAGTTDYQYIPEYCPEDGFYTVVNSCDGCKRDWHSISSDHTGGNGYMMLVNASFTPGVFYKQTVRNQLCSNTSYEFSAWLMNILKPDGCSGSGIKPNITFSVETTSGVQLGSFNTGEIASTATPQWKQYTFLFKVPANITDVVIKMTNNAPGGCGNDIAIDDIAFRPNGPTASIQVGTGQRNTVFLCEGEGGNFDISMKDIIAEYKNPVFQWQYKNSNNDAGWVDMPGETSPRINVNASPALGIYQYRMGVVETASAGFSNCMVYSNPVTIDVSAYPVPIVSSNSPACTRQALRLTASGGATYRWTGPNGFTSTQQNPVINNVTMAAAGEYKVTVTSAKGCSTDASTVVKVNPSPTASVGSGASICEGGSVQLSASGGGKYRWFPSLGLSDSTIANPIASPTDTTVYTVIVTNEFGCSDSKKVTVNVWKAPQADAGADVRITNGETIQLHGKAGGTNVRYSWSPAIYLDDPNSLTPLASPLDDITYTLTVVSEDGCGIATDEVFIRVFNEVAIPNAFSPNGDGINDQWNIGSIEKYPLAKIMIYTRNGQLIFQTLNGKAWDGRFEGNPVPAGTYYYIIELEADLPKKSGWVMVAP